MMTPASMTSAGGAARGFTLNEIWRYPVKSMQGEQLSTAQINDAGIVGDRGWALLDVATGKALTARREPNLLFGAASVSGQRDGQLIVAISLPDGETVSGTGIAGLDDPATNDALSTWLGRPVELQRATETPGTYETQTDETETGDWIQWSGPPGSFHDSTRTRVSMVSQATLRDWSAGRFRINLILDGDGEDSLVGSTIGLGSTVLNVTKQIDRCVVTTRPQPGGIDRDLSVLKTINAEREGLLGIGCLVETQGTINVSDAVRAV